MDRTVEQLGEVTQALVINSLLIGIFVGIIVKVM